MSRSLEARALRWRRHSRWIVDDVSLIVHPAEIVGLLGPNGAGKTVTMSMIAGLLTPTSGRVTIDGIDVTGLPLHERARCGLAYLPQERSIFMHLTVEENVRAILEARGVSGRDARERTDRLLAEFGLTPLRGERAERLSGGEQRRLEVARSLTIEPRYLMFDEPFAGIDPLTIESLHGILAGLRSGGAGVLLTDHNVIEALTLCDRAYVLLDGTVLAEGTPQEIEANDKVRAHFLGETFALAP